jgi:tight adherence protein B
MNPATSVVAAVTGGGLGLGVVLAVSGGAGLAAPWLRSQRAKTGPGVGWRVRPRRVAVGVAAAVAATAVTGWPVAGLLVAAGVIALPGMLASDSSGQVLVGRVEAVAGWAEMLRDTLSAAAGLEQAIIVTAPIAPEPIRAEIEHLAAALTAGQHLSPALRATADRLADPTADLVISALVMAAERHARDLGQLLGSLATAAREQAGMRMRVYAGRASARTSVRVIVGVTATMAGGLIGLNRPYLTPFDSPAGQLMLLAVGGLFASSYLWMARITRVRPLARILVTGGTVAAMADREGGR